MEHKGIVLLVEDNKKLIFANAQALKLRGYSVLTAENLVDARERLSQTEPDVVLLDIMLPDGNGFDFCEEIRGNTKAHIIFLTAKTAHEDKARGLIGGGDAYITKPFHAEEMLLMVDAAIRRKAIEKAPVQIIKKGSLILDIIASQASIGSKDLLLQAKEFSFLCLLVLRESEIITAEELYKKVWGRPMGNDKATIQKTASGLRKKIEVTGYTVRNVYGKGYIFEPL